MSALDRLDEITRKAEVEIRLRSTVARMEIWQAANRAHALIDQRYNAICLAHGYYIGKGWSDPVWPASLCVDRSFHNRAMREYGQGMNRLKALMLKRVSAFLKEE